MNLTAVCPFVRAASFKVSVLVSGTKQILKSSAVTSDHHGQRYSDHSVNLGNPGDKSDHREYYARISRGPLWAEAMPVRLLFALASVESMISAPQYAT